MKIHMNKTNEVRNYFYNPTIDEFLIGCTERSVPKGYDTIIVDKSATAEYIDKIFFHLYEKADTAYV